MAARLSETLMTAAKLARHQRRLNAGMPPRPDWPKTIGPKNKINRNPDFGLALFTDDSGRDWPGAARRLPRGSLVVIRSREAAKRAAMLERLSALPNLRLLVADDPALALLADGLHLPEARAHEAGHWRARHPEWIITASAHSLRAVMGLAHADAVFLSPVFPTASHGNAPALGPLRAAFIAAQATLPVYALGGVTADSAPRLARVFAGIAAIAGLCEN
jgi:thiamine-phosphate pyrophosphorylase